MKLKEKEYVHPKLIKHELHCRYIPHQAVAERAGVSEPYVTQILNGQKNPVLKVVSAALVLIVEYDETHDEVEVI